MNTGACATVPSVLVDVTKHFLADSEFGRRRLIQCDIN